MQNSISDRFGNTVPEYFTGYFKKSGNGELVESLQNNLNNTIKFISSIPGSKENFAYQPGKWSIKEVLMHIIDVERIFAMRAVRFARNDKTKLPGFDENEYVFYYNAEKRTLKSIADEYAAVRNATIQLYLNFDDKMLERTGGANNSVMSVEALGRILVGHELHHIEIIKERYLPA